MTSNDHLTLDINTDLARRILVEFVRTEVRRVGFERGVVGLSGGLDSAVVCYLTAEALGPDHVLAVRMPYKTSPPESLEHAQLVIEATGVQSITIPIADLVDPLFERYPDADRLRRGNAMARARMIVLYDQSAATRGLVIGTGNKTEILMGYTTQFGDAACAINPLGDLYKTQVRQLARALGVPQEILAKPPSAELWLGQTDEGEMGFTYEEVDRLLLLLVDGRYPPQACVEAGFDRAFVDAVLERIRRSQYKRAMPPIAKLSNRTVGYDFLYPRDWGT